MTNLATYLNDHLAGSVAGLNMLEHIIDRLESGQDRSSMERIKAEIEAEQEELKGMIEKLDAGESSVRKAGAWLSEKFAEVKLRFDDISGGPFLLFESLEAVSLGIEGKRSLWRALATVAEQDESLRLGDYDRLIRQAEQQRDVVERLRLDTAVKAFTAEDK